MKFYVSNRKKKRNILTVLLFKFLRVSIHVHGRNEIFIHWQIKQTACFRDCAKGLMANSQIAVVICAYDKYLVYMNKNTDAHIFKVLMVYAVLFW